MYDPRACGARCDECVLKGNTVVPPETYKTKAEVLVQGRQQIAVVGEAPGEQEERQERPFVGPSGWEMDKALRQAGINRRDVHVTNVLLCRPPGNEIDLMLRKISRQNQEAAKRAKDADAPIPPPIPTPLECCRPRLENELAEHTNFITMGKFATNAITGGGSGILSVRGGLQTLAATERTPPRRVMPTVHPAFVLRQQRWSHVFRNDIFKAAQWFRGATQWMPPKVTYQPTIEQLRTFLQTNELLAYDVETDAIECLTAKIRCIGIGNTNEVMVVSFRSIHGHLLVTPAQWAAYVAVLKEYFEDPSKHKVGHNSGYYDKIVMREQLGIIVEPNIDTMLLHKNVESELPHSLAHVASIYTDAPSWKTDREGNKLALGGESDEQLAEYNANDVAITARVLTPLIEQVRLRDQVDVWKVDQRMQALCADMHSVGMYVNQEARLKEEKRLLASRHDVLERIRSGLNNDDFNPGSVYQLRDLLFKKWELDPPVEAEEKFTATGDNSTGDLILRALLSDRTVPEEQREFIKLIRRYRKLQKILGTYVCKLRPWDMEADVGWDDDDDWVDKETRDRYGQVKQGIVNPKTGRMYPGYNAHVAVTGRLSSSKPINAQNFPKGLRGLVTPAPGHILVGADMDQLELRIAAALWGVDLYLRAFAEGKDPHSMTAYAVFGEAFCKAAGVDPACFARSGKLVGASFDESGKFIGEKEDKKMRDLSKAVQYASQYMGAVETVHKLIQKTEVPATDENGNPLDDGTTVLPYALLPLKRVREMRDNWLKGAPEFELGWDREISEFRSYGFLAEPVGLRRRDFLDGEDPNQIVNFKVQGAAAGLMNKAILQLHEEIPLHKWGPGTGIINQCHDSIVIECPIDGAEWVPDKDPKKAAKGKGKWVAPKGSIPWRVQHMMEEAMVQEHPSLPGVKFTASADLGMTWKAVG